MTDLDALIATARSRGASDLHLEGGLPPALRVQGALQPAGEPLSAADIAAFARALLPGDAWGAFLERGSADLSRTIQGVRCRLNVLQTARGVGMAIRLLTGFQATLATLNLHPDLKRLVAAKHGLVMVCGPTGCGKSSTIAALLQEINVTEMRHIVTIESPIEHLLTPRLSLIRQRQVGRDTPSFEQALVDALREDPDVLMVGEMRDPETMRLTLGAAETGHLVFTTVHSSSAAEAVARVVSAFPAESQPAIAAQLADCLAGVVCQRLRFRDDVGMRVPECEVMMPSSGVRGIIRSGQFSRLGSALETGGQEGQWTWARYRAWLDARTDWQSPPAARVTDTVADQEPPRLVSTPSPGGRRGAARAPAAAVRPAARPMAAAPDDSAGARDEASGEGEAVHVIDDVDDPATVLEELRRRR